MLYDSGDWNVDGTAKAELDSNNATATTNPTTNNFFTVFSFMVQLV